MAYPTFDAQRSEALNNFAEAFGATVKQTSRLVDLQFDAARRGFHRQLERMDAGRSIKNPADLIKWQEEAQKAEFEEFGNFVRQACGLFAESQRELAAAVEKNRKLWGRRTDEAVERILDAAPDATPLAGFTRQAMKTMDEAFESAADFTRKAFESGVENTMAAVNGGGEVRRRSVPVAQGGREEAAKAKRK